MPELTSLFPDVADALDIESVAIVEKDYFVVDLLRLLGNDSNLLIVFYVQIMPDDFVMQLHRF